MNTIRLGVLIFIASVVHAAVYGREQVSDTVSHPTSQLQYHLRVQPRGGGSHMWGVEWHNPADSLVYFVTVWADPESAADPAYGYAVQISAGIHTPDFTERIDRHRGYLRRAPSQTGGSLIIQSLNGNTVVKTGSDRVELTFPLAIPFGGPAEISGYIDTPGEILRHSISAKERSRAEMMPFASVDDLYAHLEASTDPCEGLWTYFDRNNDPLLSRMGGRYTLATVADGPDRYQIIYLAGAAESEAEWPAGRIKGTLRRATFPGVFDMQWIQPAGEAIDADTGALFEGDMLSLLFPLWQTTVRLRHISL